MIKCDLCTDRRERGLEPACVATCPTEALLFGDMEQLEQIAAERKATRFDGKGSPAAFFTMREGACGLDTFLSRAAKKKPAG
jgi:Fe-S-cluster-containing dehydrogenase component